MGILLLGCLIQVVAAQGLQGRPALPTMPQALNDLHHTTWTLKDGIPGPVRVMAQTSDGYLWIGALDGLYRFDGLRFERFDAIAGQELPARLIYSLHAIEDRGLWVGFATGGGVLVRDGRIEAREPFANTATVVEFAKDKDGVLWVITSGALLRQDKDRWTNVTSEFGLKGLKAGVLQCYELKVDGDGNLWLSTSDALYIKRRGANRLEAVDFPSHRPFTHLAVANDGRVWATGVDERLLAAMPRDGQERLWLYRLPRPGVVDDGAIAPRLISPEYIAPLIDRAGMLWYAGTHGLAREDLSAKTPALRQQSMQGFASEQGLSGDGVRAVFEDRDGAIWVGTGGGLDRFRPAAIDNVRFQTAPSEVSMAQAPNGNMWFKARKQPFQVWRAGALQLEDAKLDLPCQVNRLAFDPKGPMYVACNTDFYVKDADRFTRLPRPGDGAWMASRINHMVLDHSGDLWALVGQLGLQRLHRGRWEGGYSKFWPGLARGTPTTLAVDEAGQVLVGFFTGSLSMVKGGRVHTIGPNDGLRVGSIGTISVNGSRVWIAGARGIQLISEPRRPFLQTSDPRATEMINGLMETAEGDLWLNGLGGIVHIAAAEVRASLANPDRPMAFTRYDALDGLNGGASWAGSGSDSISRTSDGRLWFLLNNGVASIDPKRVLNSSPDLRADVQRVIAGDKTYPMGGLPRLELPAGTSDLEIQYAAPGASIPERVRFRYQLKGLDRDWHDAGARRQAFYTNLGPGTYSFRVQTSTDGKTWMDTSAPVELGVPPTLTQTWWFRLSCGVLLVALLITVIWLRLRSLAERAQERVLVRVRERERVAQDLHDTLLQGVMSLILRLQGETQHVPEPQRPRMQRIVDDANATWNEARDRVRNLRGEESRGTCLEDVLSDLGEQLSQTGGNSFSLQVQGVPRRLRASSLQEIELIAREALFNAFQHAQAAHIDVTVRYARAALLVQVSDDGIGIPAEVSERGGRPGHWGLSGMHERAQEVGACIEVSSGREGGARVSVSLNARLAYEEASPRLTWRGALRWMKALALGVRGRRRGHGASLNPQ